MKKWIIVIGICLLMICSVLPITVVATIPKVRLPIGNVTMIAQYGYGSGYYFDITLQDVPTGYDITNGDYHGWCVEHDKLMHLGASHRVLLRSSLGPHLTPDFQDIQCWNEINYIINHRQGINRTSVQNAIWYFTDDIDCSDDIVAQALVNETKHNGTIYIPQSGELLAIAMVGIDTIQLAFLELMIPIPSDFQGLVWDDIDKDGIQDELEPGIKDVTVRLYRSDNTSIGETKTNAQGYYSFADVPPGDYYLHFTCPSGYIFTLKNAVNDTTLDSDADPTTGKTIIFTVSANETITGWDAGMYKESSGGTPTPPNGETPTNIRPTADAGAGEPYRGFINGTITFDGSRSYDLDGRIISWRWDFGDGNNGTGEITTHVYAAPGTYNVTLVVMDNNFTTDTYTTTALITLGNNPPGKPVMAGPLFGYPTISYEYTVVATDVDGDNLKYFISWGDGTEYNSTFVMSGSVVQTSHQWTAPGFYFVQAYAQDTYDEISDINQIRVAIGVKYVGGFGYLIDENGDGVYDKFHSNATGGETAVSKRTDGNYLIDTNGDGQWDLEYDPQSGQTQDYSEQPILEYTIIIIIIVVIILILISILLRKKK